MIRWLLFDHRRPLRLSSHGVFDDRLSFKLLRPRGVDGTLLFVEAPHDPHAAEIQPMRLAAGTERAASNDAEGATTRQRTSDAWTGLPDRADENQTSQTSRAHDCNTKPCNVFTAPASPRRLLH